MTSIAQRLQRGSRRFGQVTVDIQRSPCGMGYIAWIETPFFNRLVECRGFTGYDCDIKSRSLPEFCDQIEQIIREYIH